MLQHIVRLLIKEQRCGKVTKIYMAYKVIFFILTLNEAH